MSCYVFDSLNFEYYKHKLRRLFNDSEYENILSIIDNIRSTSNNEMYHLKVFYHGINSLEFENSICYAEKFCVLMACLLYGYNNHIQFMKDNNFTEDEQDLIIEMIHLIPYSINRNRSAYFKWMLLPRDCSRLESMGAVGVLGYYYHCLNTGKPIYSNNLYLQNDSLMKYITNYITVIGLRNNLKSRNSYILSTSIIKRRELSQILKILPNICPSEDYKKNIETYIKAKYSTF